MNVVVKQPGETAIVISIRRSHRALDELIGGTPSQCLRYRDDARGINLLGFCDDDGISKALPLNFARPQDSAPIHGAIVFTSEKYFKTGLDWCGLSPLEVNEALELLAAIAPDKAP